jgi:hypothetical protein
MNNLKFSNELHPLGRAEMKLGWLKGPLSQREQKISLEDVNIRTLDEKLNDSTPAEPA